MIRRPPRSTLFPSTTLSRSRPCTSSIRTRALRSGKKSPSASPPRPRRPDRFDPPRGGAPPGWRLRAPGRRRSEEHTFELQSRQYLVCRLLLEKKKKEADERD